LKEDEEEMLMPSRVMLRVMKVVKIINEENDTKVLPFFLFCFFVIFKIFDFQSQFGQIFAIWTDYCSCCENICETHFCR